MRLKPSSPRAKLLRRTTPTNDRLQASPGADANTSTPSTWAVISADPSARRRRDPGCLIALVTGLAVIYATGVYAPLVAARVGGRGATVSAVETQDAALAARIEVQVNTVADLDRRLGQIDTAIEEAAKRGKTNTALSVMEAQRWARASLASELAGPFPIETLGLFAICVTRIGRSKTRFHSP